MKASPSRPARGRLRSLRVSDGFRRFALDQLSSVPGLRANAMFGGIGLYADDVFFGILASDVLFFKVGDSNRHAYEAAGSKPFKPYPDRSMIMPYYEVPIAALEDASTLVVWAARAVEVAKASKKAQTKRKAPQSRIRAGTGTGDHDRAGGIGSSGSGKYSRDR